MKSMLYMLAIVILIACSKDDPKVVPIINSFTPDKGVAGTIVTIDGNNFSENTSQNSVTFNGKIATVNSATANQLVVVVPAGATSGKIKVSVNGSAAQSADDFIVFGVPSITSFSPISGEAGTLVTITGSSFSSTPSENVVKFGDGDAATVTTATATSLTVTVPVAAVSGFISVTTHGLTGNSVSEFTVNPAISNIAPMSASIGSTITITGSALKGSNVTFNNIPAKKISETATEVKVMAPYQSMNDRTVTIRLINSNVTLTYPTLFNYVNSWVRKKDFPGIDRQQAASFAIGSKAYFGLGYEYSSNQVLKDFWEYDPSTDTWTKKNDFTGGARSGTFSFAVGGRGYVGTGFKIDNGTNVFLNDTWGYEPVTDTWAPRADFGGVGRNTAGAFIINNKAYVGAGAANGVKLKDFWEYDPTANSWTRKADYGGEGRDSPFAFSIGEKGYLGGGVPVSDAGIGDFWEYDLSSNQWTKKANSPIGGLFAEYVGFSINNILYAGSNQSYNRYDQQSNAWLKMDFPSTYHFQSKAVVINGKAYVLRGTELWEFTPPN